MTGGTKYDTGKPRYALLPWDAIEEVAKVMTYGAAKYDDRNWERGMSWDRPFSAAMRHLVAFWQKREDLDPESGCYHLASAACNILFLLAFQLRGVGEDNRPGGGSDER
jgi:hypothetical protein